MRKILALVLTLALVVCAIPVMAEETKVMTDEEYMAAEDGELVCIETYAQAHEGWWKDEKTGVGQCSIYAQNDHCGYFIYNAPCSEEEAAKLVDGQKIRVVGTKIIWNGLVEISSVTSMEILEGDPFVAETEDLTASFASSDDLEKHMNEKVAFKGLKIVAKKFDGDDKEYAFTYGWDGQGQPGGDLYFDVELDEVKYTFTVESYLCGQETDVYKAVEGLKIGDTVDCEGFLYWYEGPQMHATSVTVTAAAE